MNAANLYTPAASNVTGGHMMIIDTMLLLRAEFNADHIHQMDATEYIATGGMVYTEFGSYPKTVDRFPQDSWSMLNTMCKDIFGEFGFLTLDEEQTAQVIHIEAANARAAEFGFEDIYEMDEYELRDLFNMYPELIKQ